MNKKPDLFVNKIDKDIKNNEKVYYSKYQNKKETVIELLKNDGQLSKNVNQKINSIFTSSNYIYKAEVKITFKDTQEIKKIVGKNRNYLITMDNELISIKDIVDIEIL
ncbi:MAG: hypothetical protein RR325_03970 [Bacilli bacterium]